ncbi:hypothetical protein Dda_2724 [Drechslerella dactyloides]|uniref:PH domain protein n=1 Tax=Drechslerella dactyloides TaxID=74499 RepID=A0AAD6NL50_DREDA|nr:hypothetical protein Dda_2724 [Drechslerella dactyloides]
MHKIARRSSVKSPKMSKGMIGKFVLGRVFKESAANKEGREDPYYEYPAAELNKAGKRRSRRRKKALPPGLTDEEGETLTKVKRRAYRLDMSFGSFLGVRFGWGSVLGIIPLIGDGLDMLLALMVVRTATQVQLPTFLLLHMLINVAFDFVIGLIPFLGDLIDAGYKCNTRNAVLLERHLRQVGRARLKEQGIIDPEDNSLPTGSADESGPSDIDLEAQAPAPRRGDRDRHRNEHHRDDDRRHGNNGGSSGGNHHHSGGGSSRRDDEYEHERRDRNRDRDRRRDTDSSDSDRHRSDRTHTKSKRKGGGRSDDSRRGGSSRR